MQILKLRQQIFRGALNRPIIGSVIATAYAAGSFGRAVRGMKQIIESEQQTKNGHLQMPGRRLWAFPAWLVLPI